MGNAGTALFLVCGMIALVAACGTVIVKSPIRAAMCLLVHITALAGIFLTLHAHVLAALQVIVYAGAVVVLFVFVIMLIGPAVPEHTTSRGLITKGVGASLMGVIALAVAANLLGDTPDRPPVATCAPGVAECSQFGGVFGFSQALFVDGVVPFELISILLTVAIVGAIAVARGRSAQDVEEARRREAERKAKEDADRAREQKLAAEVAAHGGH